MHTRTLSHCFCFSDHFCIVTAQYNGIIAIRIRIFVLCGFSSGDKHMRKTLQFENYCLNKIHLCKMYWYFSGFYECMYTLYIHTAWVTQCIIQNLISWFWHVDCFTKNKYINVACRPDTRNCFSLTVNEMAR